MKIFLAFKPSDVVYIMLINVKMPTIVGILTFMSMLYFTLSLVKKVYNLGAFVCNIGHLSTSDKQKDNTFHERQEKHGRIQRGGTSWKV